MASSFALYAWAVVALVGVISLARPLKAIGIRNRWWAWLVIAAGVSGAWATLDRPALSNYVTNPSRQLDVFMPIYQFDEVFEIPVRATADQVYRAALQVSDDEIPFYRTLVWIRRGMTGGPESMLNPPDGVPLIGATTVPGLFLNTGHGHLGWTQAAGSAALLADLMTGHTPDIDPTRYAPARFSL